MKRTTSAVLMAAGIGCLVAGSNSCNSYYSNEAIWKRQKPFVERIANADTKSARFDELRAGLTTLSPEDKRGRCVFETKFQALVVTGNPKVAEKMISSRSYEPFENCKPSNINYGSADWFWGGGALIVLGLYGLINSFRKKND